MYQRLRSWHADWAPRHDSSVWTRSVHVRGQAERDAHGRHGSEGSGGGETGEPVSGPNVSSSLCAVAGAGCYYTVTPGALNTDQGDGRVDWHYNDANSIFGTISWSNTAKTSVQPLPGALDGGDFNGTSETDLGRNAMLSWSHTFSPTMVNEARRRL